VETGLLSLTQMYTPAHTCVTVRANARRPYNGHTLTYNTHTLDVQVWQQQKESRVMVKKRHSIPAAELPRLAPLTRRDGLQTDRRHHQPHNSLGALFNAKVVFDRVIGRVIGHNFHPAQVSVKRTLRRQRSRARARTHTHTSVGRKVNVHTRTHTHT
jgi:hypothetical protein